MPRWSQPIVIDGKVVGIACGSSPSRRCVTCGRTASIQCDHPVMRRGKAATCDRWCCRGCSTSVGPDRDFCAPHARAEAKEAP